MFKHFSIAVLLASGALLDGQITQKIQAHISHSFVIGKKTLPPGDYTFLMQHDSESNMIISNDETKKSVDFVVRHIEASKAPAHAQLVFRKYGDTEFLSKIFQSGESHGIELTETKSQEAQFVKDGKAVEEHVEDAK